MSFRFSTHIPQTLIDWIDSEIQSAISKHGAGTPATKQDFLSILVEEVGEIAKSINKEETNEMLLGEAIQVIAVCIMYHNGQLKMSPK